MEIRRAQPTDREAVLQLVTEIDADDYIPYCFDDWVTDIAGGVFLVAYAEEKLLGIANVHFLDDRIAWLQALRVATWARRSGVGTMLAQACLHFSAKAGRQVARLLIDSDNHASLNLTAQAGFNKIIEWLRLEKQVQPLVAPCIQKAEADQLAQLVNLAKDHDLKLWHTDWETHDFGIQALKTSLKNGSLYVLADTPAAAMLDATYDEDDQEYMIFNITGKLDDVKQLLSALEHNAYKCGIPRVVVLLPVDSPHLANTQQLGYKFAIVKDKNGLDMIDGVTIWEYNLTGAPIALQSLL